MPTDFAAAYSRALRFGRAPAEGIADFAEQTKAHGGTTTPNNTADHVFADWLQDHDDPRHLIVRRDLETRALAKEGDDVIDQWQRLSGEDFAARTGKSLKATVGGNPLRPESEDGQPLTIYPRHTKAGKVVGYHCSWIPSNAIHYHGFLHPAEFDHLAEQLDLPHRTAEIEAAYKAKPAAAATATS